MTTTTPTSSTSSAGRDGMNQLTPLWLLKYLPNMLACHVTIVHQLKAPRTPSPAPDASGHLAIGEAFRTIQRGNADLAICGGAESKVSHMGLIRHCLLKRLTEQNENPYAAVRPFDAQASGTAIAEGGGLMILEEYERAQSRGAKSTPSSSASPPARTPIRSPSPRPPALPAPRPSKKQRPTRISPPTAVDLLVPNGLGLPSTTARADRPARRIRRRTLKNPHLPPRKAKPATSPQAAGGRRHRRTRRPPRRRPPPSTPPRSLTASNSTSRDKSAR